MPIGKKPQGIAEKTQFVIANGEPDLIVVGDIVAIAENGGAVRADATDATRLPASGVVSGLFANNIVTIVTGGDLVLPGLTVVGGESFYLDPANPGKLTTVRPTEGSFPGGWGRIQLIAIGLEAPDKALIQLEAEPEDPFMQGSGSIIIKDENGVIVAEADTLNFLGLDIEALQDPNASNQANIYSPPLPPPPDPTYASHWNTSDGDTGNQSVSASGSTTSAHIATPSGGEGVPFKTGGWAGSNHPATRTTSQAFTTNGDTTGFGGDASVQVTLYDADGVTALDTYTSPALAANATHTSPSGHLEVVLANYGVDDPNYPAKQKARMTVNVDAGASLTAAGLQGGKYSVQIVMTPDTVTDGTGPYTYTMAARFIDTNPTTPSISGGITISENAGAKQTVQFSGLTYYALNSQFMVDVTGIDQLNRNTSRTSANLVVNQSNYGLSNLSQSTGTLTGWTNAENQDGVSFSKNNWAITQNNYLYYGNAASVSSYARDTWANGGNVSSPNQKVLINTKTSSSSNTVEDFLNEDRRQDSTYNGGTTGGNWNSSATLQSGEAMVFNSYMMAPNQSGSFGGDWSDYTPSGNPDYSTITVPVNFYRTIVDTSVLSRASFSVVFTGSFVSNATNDLKNGHLEIFIRRRASSNGGNTGTGAPPLLLHGSSYNFASFDDGASDGHIREDTSSGNTVNATFGGFVCETGFFIEIRILNSAIQINRLSVTFF
jgi:hypothetical protein